MRQSALGNPVLVNLFGSGYVTKITYEQFFSFGPALLSLGPTHNHPALRHSTGSTHIR
jgi:hypothetical protein